MAGTIICGVDGSLDSRAGLDTAVAFAERLGARLVLAHVVEYPQTPHAAAAFAALDDGQEEAGTRLLEQVALESGVEQAERRVVTGNPAERLAELADEMNADFIVVGSRGRGAFKAAFLGSVSNSLVGVARCPVLIVPRGAGSEERR
jgi:nucleotide-binding universal stress UspA family protein